MSENFQFLEVKFSIYLNRCDFVMCEFSLYTVGVRGEHTDTEWQGILDTALKENETMALPIDVYKVTWLDAYTEMK